jgi:hypothetical protein
VPDAQYNEFGSIDLVYEDIGPDHQFEGARHCAETPESRIDAQSIATTIAAATLLAVEGLSRLM